MVLSRKISEVHVVLLVSSKVVQWHVVHFLGPLEGFTVSTQSPTAPVRIGTHSATLHRATTSLFLPRTRQCLNGVSRTDGSLRHFCLLQDRGKVTDDAIA